MTADGGFTYASNRGSDTIFYAKNVGDRFENIGWFSSGGRTPRNFALSPDERFFIVANQDTHNVLTLHRDVDTGGAGECISEVRIPYPVCVTFLPRNVMGENPNA